MDKKVQIILIVVVALFIGYLGYNYFAGGALGFYIALTKSIKIILILMAIGAVFAVVYFLWFFEKKINASYEVYKDIRGECKLNKRSNMGYLWISGDIKHSPKMIGKIVGFSVRQNYDSEKDKNKMSYYVNESIFTIRRTGDSIFTSILGHFMNKPIIRCPQRFHDTLQGDVYINCVGLVKHGFFFYPNTVHQNWDNIDKTIYNESLRFIQLDVIRVAHNLIMKAMGVTAFDKKELEGERGIDMVKKEKNQITGGGQ